MKKSSFFLGGAFLLVSLFTTSCKEVLGSLDNPVSSYLTVNVADVTIPTGDTFQLKTETINSDNPVTYQSSDESVATVDANGLVTGVADGEATIVVSVAASQYYQTGIQEVKVAVKRPLTFEALTDGGISVYFNSVTLEKPIVYSKNGEAKQEITTYTWIPAEEGDKFTFESANEQLTPGDGSWGVQIVPNMKTAVYGNVMSMISPDGNYHVAKAITKPYALMGLLCGTGNWEYNSDTDNWDCKELYTVEHEKYKLLLPATKLSESCYNYFLAYTGFTKTPELPATEIPASAYQQLFESCYFLNKANAINVEKVGSGAFRWMFENCTALTEAPAITVENVDDYGMASMFYGCTKMTKANTVQVKKCDGEYGLAWMFSMCTALEKAPTLSVETLGESAYNAMFYNCQSLEEAPALPATKLAPYCYNCMFESCTNLKKAPALPATKLENGCYNGMFSDCSSLEEAPELKAESLPAQCYMYMFLNCYKLSKVTCLAKEMTGYNAISYMLAGAGTDESVTERTFTRSTANNNWAYCDTWDWIWDINDWKIPTGWTIDPAITASSAPARRAVASVKGTPIKTPTSEMKSHMKGAEPTGGMKAPAKN